MLEASLIESSKTIDLQAVPDVVDEVWDSMGNRSERPTNNLITLSVDYSGKVPSPLPSVV